MKYLLSILGLFLALSIKSQSLLDADSIIVIQTSDTTFNVLAVTIYPGLSASALKSVFKDRFDKNTRLKLQSAKTALRFEEKARQDEAKYTQITGDTIVIDSVYLDGEWTIKGGEVNLKFTVTDNKSTSAKVKVKIVSSEELIVSLDKVGEITFYRQEDGVWLGKADIIYKMTLDKPKVKNKK